MAPGAPPEGQGCTPEQRAAALAQALGDPKCITRYEAAKALGGLGAAAAPWVSSLAEAMSDQERIVRCAAAGAVGSLAASGAFGALGPLGAGARQTACTALMKALKDKSPWVRRAAAASLGSICIGGDLGLEAVLALVKTLQDEEEGVQHSASDALKALDETCSDMLAQALEHKDVNVRMAAIVGLAELGPTSESHMEKIVQRLQDPHGTIRKKAAETLGQLGPTAASAAVSLGQKLRDCDPGVRCAASEALKQIGDAGAETLAERLGDPDENTRQGGAEALAHLGSEAAPHAAALAEALRDPSMRVRNAAAKALGALGPDAALHVAALSDMLKNSEDLETQCAAASALVELGEVGTRVVLEAISGWNERLRCCCAAIGLLDRLVPYSDEDLALRNRLFHDRNWIVRVGACSSLANLSTASSRQGPPPHFFAQALVDGDVRLRRTAVEALGSVGGTQNEAVLERALGDSEWSVRMKAAEALGKLGTGDGAALVQVLLQDCNEAVRFAAAQALLALGPAIAAPHTATILEALKDPDESVRCEVSRILWAIGDGVVEHASQLVLKLSEAPASTRREAASVLRCIGPTASAYASAISHVFTMEKDPSVRRELAITLQAMGSEVTNQFVNSEIIRRAAEAQRSTSPGSGQIVMAPRASSDNRLHTQHLMARSAVQVPRIQAAGHLQRPPSMPQLPVLNHTPRGVNLTPRSMDAQTIGVAPRTPRGNERSPHSAILRAEGGYPGGQTRADVVPISARTGQTGSLSPRVLAFQDKIGHVRQPDGVNLYSPRRLGLAGPG
eukprot:gnl/MRDRNA2_/MRDRNA2_57784_c0_seq1.p1 gnl/MRDRNA2_/MRDRNA2_57784_c0~~gnl/MRDRNA2_/MRDRNA2_57784_c0_seq1.p1  ORF type:complete len:810 (-),score=172.39 gnl/MRDRNA2_/MRDRNA2_57784_c0_seq1:203-2581(-)